MMMTFDFQQRHPRSRLRTVLRDRRGAAAVEFALMLPLMLIIFVGVSEVSEAVPISRKVTITTRAVTDLTTQYTSVDNDDLSNILGASSPIIAPYAPANLVVTLSEVGIDKNSNATITRSCSPTARRKLSARK
jgi:Flp pilus assembly protein TadG